MKRWAVLAPLAVMAACAMTPEADSAMQRARASLQQAAAHPEVALRAPVELQVAQRSLAEAERLWKSGADAPIVAHHAYLADQRARIAVETAEYRRAEAVIATNFQRKGS